MADDFRPGDAAGHARILAAIGVDEPPPEPTAPAAPQAEQPTESAPQETAEQDAAPAAEQPSGEETEVETEDAPPAVDPPASWGREHKEAFKTLPPETQRAIAERERERDVELRRGQDEAANLRKAAELEAQQARQLREQYHRQLTEAVPAIQNRLNAWSGVNWVELGANNPTEYARLRSIYDVEQEQLGRALQEKQVLDHQARQEYQQAIARHVEEQEQKLPSLIPEWRDADRGKKEFSEVRSYLAKEGVPEELVRGLVDAVQIRIARKAMLYDAAQAKLAKPVVTAKAAPKVLKPGSARAPENSAQQAREEGMNKLRQSGNILDAARLIAQSL